MSFGAREKVLKERVKESGCDFEASASKSKRRMPPRRASVCVRESKRESLLSSDDVKQMKGKKIFVMSVPFDFFFSSVCRPQHKLFLVTHHFDETCLLPPPSAFTFTSSSRSFPPPRSPRSTRNPTPAITLCSN